jgi:poly(A) polymerase
VQPSRKGTGTITTLRIIPRAEHSISRAQISENALKVLYRLKAAGYQAYLVGGGVRDLLLGREPKDFDVATDARPEQVKEVFRNCRLIGRRFRLAHVFFGQDIVEVATFRRMAPATEDEDVQVEGGMILRDNVYGTIEEDALRRDFTVNALYYNIADFSVVDYASGMEDLRAGVLRLLGPPDQRYREDPVRMLRAIRFAAKLGFAIDPEAEMPLREIGVLLHDVPAARLFEEVLKLFLYGFGVEAFEKLRHYGLFRVLFPDTEEALAHEEADFPITFVYNGLRSTDARVRDGKSVTPFFLFAVLLWEPVRQLAEQLEGGGMDPFPAMEQASYEIVITQAGRVALPKRFSLPMREIWMLQHRFLQRGGRRPLRLLTHPRFRAAFDFFLLRAESGEVDTEIADWWAQFEAADSAGRDRLLSQAGGGEGKRKRRRRGRRRGSGRAAPDGVAEAADAEA